MEEDLVGANKVYHYAAKDVSIILSQAETAVKEWDKNANEINNQMRNDRCLYNSPFLKLWFHR